jgi:hypothetical protein
MLTAGSRAQGIVHRQPVRNAAHRAGGSACRPRIGRTRTPSAVIHRRRYRRASTRRLRLPRFQRLLPGPPDVDKATSCAFQPCPTLTHTGISHLQSLAASTQYACASVCTARHSSTDAAFLTHAQIPPLLPVDGRHGVQKRLWVGKKTLALGSFVRFCLVGAGGQKTRRRTVSGPCCLPARPGFLNLPGPGFGLVTGGKIPVPTPGMAHKFKVRTQRRCGILPGPLQRTRVPSRPPPQ